MTSLFCKKIKRTSKKLKTIYAVDLLFQISGMFQQSGMSVFIHQDWIIPHVVSNEHVRDIQSG